MQVIRNGLDLTIMPDVHRRTLVWIHGYGDTAELFCQDFVEAPLIPDCKVVLPTAHEVRRGGQLARSWYDRGDPSTIESSSQRICSILQEESKYTDTIFIGGFSQGAVMSLICGLCKYPGPISGIIALSGFMMNYPVPVSRRSIPVLCYHGAQDNRISLSFATESFQKYLKHINYHLEVHPTMPHEVYLVEYEFIRNWVKSILSI